MRVFLVVAALIIAFTMIEAYVAYINKFTTETVDEMPLTYLDEATVDPTLVATTGNGRVVGRPHPNGTIQFHGIPFAQAPTGELRFAAPQPVANWTGILDGTGVGPRCMQEDSMMLGVWPGGQSEDCLWLSVSTPANDYARRPVIVWIHGGGLYSGGAGEDTYDGAHLATRGDIVEVNVQYRLGIWGWLDVSHLGGEDVAGSALNGQLDQLLALQWVHDNIAQFGGDPDNVTLMGESAGAYAVASLLALPEAAPLFHRSILMSGVYTPGSSPIKKRTVTDRLMNELNARSLEDLRALSSSDLLEAQNLLGEHAQSLGYPDLMTFLEMPPPSPAVFGQAGTSGKPLLHGTTRNEYHLFTALAGSGRDPGRRLATDIFSVLDRSPEDLSELVSLLKAQHPDRGEDDLHVDVLTAALMDYPHGVLARTYGAAGAEIYRYHFTMTSQEFPELGAFHTLDLPYFFGTLDAPASAQLVGESPSVELSENMMDAITSFAASGRPTIPGGPQWPPWTDRERAVMQFGESTELVYDPLPWMDEFTATFESMR